MDDEDVIRASAPTSGDEPLALLGRAMEMLSGVSRLFEALSPAEVEAMAARMHIGITQHDDPHAVFWRVYIARHRVLKDVFATQRADLLARAARARVPAREDDR
jgi:hypothetical protein